MGQRERLNEYLKSVRHLPFQWGVHDCLTFSNAAFKSIHGYGWADDWLGRYMKDGKPLRRLETIKEFGFREFDDAIDERLERCKGVPPLGAIVTTKQSEQWLTGVALGICTGTRAVFISRKNMLSFSLDAIDKSWVKNEL
jgi:hypothetical protein